MPSLDIMPAEIRLEIYKHYVEDSEVTFWIHSRYVLVDPKIRKTTRRKTAHRHWKYFFAVSGTGHRRDGVAYHIPAGLIGACRLLRQELIVFLCHARAMELEFQKYIGENTGELPIIELLPCIPPTWRQSIQQLSMDGAKWLPYLTEVLHTGLPSLRTVTLPSSYLSAGFYLFERGPSGNSTFTKPRFDSSDRHRIDLEQSCRRMFMAKLNKCSYYRDNPIPVDIVAVMAAGYFCLHQACLKHPSPQFWCKHERSLVESHVMKFTLTLPAHAEPKDITVRMDWNPEYEEAEQIFLSRGPEVRWVVG